MSASTVLIVSNVYTSLTHSKKIILLQRSFITCRVSIVNKIHTIYGVPEDSRAQLLREQKHE